MAVTLGPRRRGAGHVRPPARAAALRAITVRRMPARTTSTRRPAVLAASRSGSTAASKKRPAAKRATANRRPAAKKKSSPGLWGVVSGSWNLLARGAGGLARSVARPEEAEPLAPEHRRDGVGLAVLGPGDRARRRRLEQRHRPGRRRPRRRRPLDHRLAGHGAAGRPVLRRPAAAPPRPAPGGARPAGDRLALHGRRGARHRPDRRHRRRPAGRACPAPAA